VVNSSSTVPKLPSFPGPSATLSFLADLRNVGQIECSPSKIFALMWGEQPITIRKYDAGSFVEREKDPKEPLSTQDATACLS
jgi:hypothetical protein